MPRASHFGILTSFVLLTITGGCEWSENDPGNSRVSGLSGAGAQAVVGEGAADPFNQGSDHRTRPDQLAAPGRTVSWVERVEQEAEEAPAEPERDLSAELHRAMGDPSRCAPTGAELPASFAVNVNVYASVTGAVTRAQVSGPGLPVAMITCLRGRAEHVRFASPVPEAPRSISARLEVERQGPPPTKTVETIRVPVAAGYELQPGQDAIAGQAGTEIQAEPSVAIQPAPAVAPPPPSGVPISPSLMGTPISGPAGRPIGQ